MKKKFIAMMIMIIATTMVLTVGVSAAETCRADQHEFGDPVGDICTCTECGTEAKLVTDRSGLASAISSAGQGAVLLLEADEYTINGEIAIKNAQKDLTIIGQIEGDNNFSSIKQQSSGNHIFHVADNSGNETALTLANLTLDGGGIAKCGVAVKYRAVVNLYHINVKGTGINGWSGIQIDNGYSSTYSDSAWNDEAVCTINAYDVNLKGNTVVPIGACSQTYAVFNYDSECNFSEIKLDIRGGDTPGFEHFLVNGVPAGEGVASITKNGVTVEYKSLADAIAMVNNAYLPKGDYTVKLLKDCGEKVVIKQSENVNITVTAAEGIKFYGQFTIDGSQRSSGAETLTFTDMLFDATESKVAQYFIYNDDAKYPHNITVNKCKFMEDEDERYVHAIHLKQIHGTDYSIKIQSCEFINVGGSIWTTGSKPGIIDKVTIKNAVEGISTGGIQWTISGSNITTTNFGIRYNMDSENTTSTNPTLVDNCTITAPKPVWLRKENNNALKSYVKLKDSALMIAGEGETAFHLDSKNGGLTMDELINPVDTHLILENCTIAFADPEAKINGTGYKTLEDAVEDADPGDEIEVLKNINDATLNGVTVDLPAGSKVIVGDGIYTLPAGSTVTKDGVETEMPYGGTVASDGTVTVTAPPVSSDRPNRRPNKKKDVAKVETGKEDDALGTITVEEITMVLTIGKLDYTLDGVYMLNDVAPIIRESRTFLPIRVVAETLGATVTWNEAEQSVTIVKDDTTIVIYIGQVFALVNGNPVQLDAPAFIANSRTYLPIRFVAENLGATVTWDAETQTVTIVGKV